MKLRVLLACTVLLAGLACFGQAGKSVIEDIYASTFLGHGSSKKPEEIRSMKPRQIAHHLLAKSSLSMSVYPTQLQDGEDAVVTFSSFPEATPEDYITVACGPTNGLSDYLDVASCGVPPAFTPGSITSITFAVGEKTAECPPGYTQVPGDLNEGTHFGKAIYLCYSKDPSKGQPISTILAVTGETELTPCPVGFSKIPQDLNEGTVPHQDYVFLCYSHFNYEAGVVDVEGVYITSSGSALSTPCATGYSNAGVNFNNGAGGQYVYVCFKEGNFTIQPPTTVRFQELVYMRCNYTFTYVNVQNGTGYALDSVVAVMVDGLGAPKQGHISLTSNDDEMMVSYTSGTINVPSVRYGLTATSLDTVVYGNSSTYTADMMCDSPANTTGQEWFRDPGYMHRVLLTGLSYDTQYFYQFGNDMDGWSQVYYFYSKAQPSTRNVNFIAYADMGISPSPAASNTAELVAQDILSDDFRFLLHFGDVSYARGQGWIWENFYRLIQPYATRIPYMMSIGNHEYDHEHGGEHDPSGAPGQGFHPLWGNMGSDSSGECAVPMYHRVSAPDNGNDIFWYSFNYGPVHVIQMSTEHDWLPGSEQYQWIENDLQNVNRTETPWVILTGHRMMYTTQLLERGDYIVSVHMRAAMDEMLYKYQVNAMLVGHQHSYERSCQVYQSKCRDDGTGTVHIIVGTAGAGLETGGFSPALGEWSLVQLQQWGYNRVYATEDTLTIQFIENQFGTIFDEVVLKPWPAPAH